MWIDVVDINNNPCIINTDHATVAYYRERRPGGTISEIVTFVIPPNTETYSIFGPRAKETMEKLKCQS